MDKLALIAWGSRPPPVGSVWAARGVPKGRESEVGKGRWAGATRRGGVRVGPRKTKPPPFSIEEAYLAGKIQSAFTRLPPPLEPTLAYYPLIRPLSDCCLRGGLMTQGGLPIFTLSHSPGTPGLPSQ